MFFGKRDSSKEALYFEDLKSPTYQRTNPGRWMKKTHFNNKKHGGAKLANSANLTHQPPTPTSHYPLAHIH